MRSGIIGVPSDSTSLGIESVEPVNDTHHEYGMDLRRVIETTDVRRFNGQTRWVEGRALFDDLEDVDKYIVDAGKISKRDGKRRVPKYAKFVAVPATDSHRGFVIISSSSADFVFDMIARQNHVTIGRPTIRLGAFLRDRPDFDVDGSGASGTGSPKAQTIMAYGNDLLNDESVGGVLTRAAQVAEGEGEAAKNLPVLSGRYDYNSRIAFVSLAASAYVNVYNPALETDEFLDWVRSEIIPYIDDESITTPTDRRTEAEKTANDPNQASLADVEDDGGDE